MNRLEGKVAIVTGAGQGLGLAIAELFASEGAKVVGTGHHVEKVEKAFALLKEKNLDVTAMQQDVSSEEDWKRVIVSTVEKYGKIDILVNNAAIMAMKSLADCSVDEFMNVFKTNTLGAFLGIKYAYTEMEKNGSGSIVNIDSIGGLTSGDADGGDIAYSASKGGTRSLTKNAAMFLSSKKIRVNSIHPAGILTDMLKAVFNNTPALWDKVKVNSPLPPHISDPMDIANGALYLASDDARTVTGTELVIDCGYMAH